MNDPRRHKARRLWSSSLVLRAFVVREPELPHVVSRSARHRQELPGRRDAARPCCAISICRSRRARWWRLSARQAWERARCFTSSAGWIAPDEGDIVIDGARLTALDDAALVRFRNQQRRLRLPVSSSAAGVQRARKRRDADAHCAHADGRGAAARRGAAAAASGSASGCRTGPGCSRAASSSGSRSRAR